MVFFNILPTTDPDFFYKRLPKWSCFKLCDVVYGSEYE